MKHIIALAFVNYAFTELSQPYVDYFVSSGQKALAYRQALDVADNPGAMS